MDRKSKSEIINSLKGGLIVSCQSLPGDPIYTEEMVVKMAEASEFGGAIGIRTDTPTEIAKIKKSKVNLPIIGLWKIWHKGETDVFITPTMEAAHAVWQAGADAIAVDATKQLTKEGRPAYEIIAKIKKEIPEAVIFADVATVEEAVNAMNLGADIVAPTLYGYTKYTIAPNVSDPAWEQPPSYQLLADMVRACKGKCVVMMEGHINTPQEAVQCMYLGADSIVVGSAITRPHLTTKRFTQLINKYSEGK